MSVLSDKSIMTFSLIYLLELVLEKLLSTLTPTLYNLYNGITPLLSEL